MLRGPCVTRMQIPLAGFAPDQPVEWALVALFDAGSPSSVTCAISVLLRRWNASCLVAGDTEKGSSHRVFDRSAARLTVYAEVDTSGVEWPLRVPRRCTASRHGIRRAVTLWFPGSTLPLLWGLRIRSSAVPGRSVVHLSTSLRMVPFTLFSPVAPQNFLFPVASLIFLICLLGCAFGVFRGSCCRPWSSCC